MSLVAFLLALGATVRLTRMANADGVTKPARDQIRRRRGRDSWSYYLVKCPWCVSVWGGIATFGLVWLLGPDHPVITYGYGALTASYLYSAYIRPATIWATGDDEEDDEDDPQEE